MDVAIHLSQKRKNDKEEGEAKADRFSVAVAEYLLWPLV